MYPSYMSLLLVSGCISCLSIYNLCTGGNCVHHRNVCMFRIFMVCTDSGRGDSEDCISYHQAVVIHQEDNKLQCSVTAVVDHRHHTGTDPFANIVCCTQVPKMLYCKVYVTINSEQANQQLSTSMIDVHSPKVNLCKYEPFLFGEKSVACSLI